MIRLLSILLLTACTALAAPVRVSWEIGAAQIGVSYRVVRVIDGAAPMPLGETSAASLVVDALAGDKLAVIAFNPEFGEAQASEPVTVAKGTARQRWLVVEVSDDMQAWTPLLALPVDRPRRFVRMKEMEP